MSYYIPKGDALVIIRMHKDIMHKDIMHIGSGPGSFVRFNREEFQSMCFKYLHTYYCSISQLHLLYERAIVVLTDEELLEALI